MDPTAEEIARAMRRSHGFRHVEEKEFSGGKPQYGPDTGVVTTDHYEAHALKVLLARGTKGFESMEGHFHFYHKESNTYLFYDKTGRYDSTCFRPRGRSRQYFHNVWFRDCQSRQDWFRGRLSEKGGYPAMLNNLGRKMPEPEAAPVQKKNAFELARERALRASAPDRASPRNRDSERER